MALSENDAKGKIARVNFRATSAAQPLRGDRLEFRDSHEADVTPGFQSSANALEQKKNERRLECP